MLFVMKLVPSSMAVAIMGQVAIAPSLISVLSPPPMDSAPGTAVVAVAGHYLILSGAMGQLQLRITIMSISLTSHISS